MFQLLYDTLNTLIALQVDRNRDNLFLRWNSYRVKKYNVKHYIKHNTVFYCS